MDNIEIAVIFSRLADLLELDGENYFKIRAYRRAARVICGLGEPLGDLLKKDTLTGVPGIGKNIADKIAELLATGRLNAYFKLAAKYPPGLLQIMQLPGIGPGRARALYDHLRIQSIGELEQMAKNRQVRKAPGLGIKSEQDILRNIKFMREYAGRAPLSLARMLAGELTAFLAALSGVRKVETAGGVRRWNEVVSDLDLVVLADDAGRVFDALAHCPLVGDVEERLPDFMRVSTRWGIPVEVAVTEKESEYAGVLLTHTGSKPHLAALDKLARSKGMGFTLKGLILDKEPVAAADEEEIYRQLGLPYFPPELREGEKEVEMALAGWRPELIVPADIRGDLHVHSCYSDGENTLEEMARTAQKLGYSYLAVCDHSRSLKIARGLSLEELRQKNVAIDQINAGQKNFRLLKGVEVDILPGGELDYPDEVLAEQDVVVASVHTAFGLPRERMTERIIKAIRNKHVDIIAHPTGRMIHHREAYALDLERIWEESARHGTWLEINASPERLDLSAENAGLAFAAGVKVAVNTDAHAVSHLENMAYGVAVARKAALPPGSVVNTMERDEILRALLGR